MVRSRRDPQPASDETMADAAATPANSSDDCISKPDFPSGSTQQPNGDSPVSKDRQYLHNANGTSQQHVGDGQLHGMSSEAATAEGHSLQSSTSDSKKYQHAQTKHSADDDASQPGAGQVQGCLQSSKTKQGAEDSSSGAENAAEHSTANGDAGHSNGLKRMSWMENASLPDSSTLGRPHTATNGHAGADNSANDGAAGNSDEDGTGDARF